MHFFAIQCQFLKMGSANVRLRHFVTGFSLSKGVRVMVECNPIKKISAWQLQGEGIRSNFQPSREIKVVLKWSARDRGSLPLGSQVSSKKVHHEGQKKKSNTFAAICEPPKMFTTNTTNRFNRWSSQCIMKLRIFN